MPEVQNVADDTSVFPLTPRASVFDVRLSLHDIIHRRVRDANRHGDTKTKQYVEFERKAHEFTLIHAPGESESRLGRCLLGDAFRGGRGLPGGFH
jgi:hypothetical protein